VEGADIGFELANRRMNSSLELLSGELSQPVFDLIDP
jgi:hypothetical protein